MKARAPIARQCPTCFAIWTDRYVTVPHPSIAHYDDCTTPDLALSDWTPVSYDPTFAGPVMGVASYRCLHSQLVDLAIEANDDGRELLMSVLPSLSFVAFVSAIGKSLAVDVQVRDDEPWLVVSAVLPDGKQWLVQCHWSAAGAHPDVLMKEQDIRLAQAVADLEAELASAPGEEPLP